MVAARQDPKDVLVYLSNSKAQSVTTASLRELLSHDEMTNDSILNTFLAILCDAHNVAFLSTFFIHILKRDKSWEGVQNWFAQHSIFESYSKPFIHSNRPILIPCHVNGAHWVGIVRRVIANKVYFLYPDDLNSVSTEKHMKNLLQTYAPLEFYPHDAIWLTCRSITYQPHSNECGSRTLFALTMMALHPQPTRDFLLSFMDTNLAQILRTWVASVIITEKVTLPEWRLANSSPNTNNQHGISSPAYLFPWEEEHSPTSDASNSSGTKVSFVPSPQTYTVEHKKSNTVLGPSPARTESQPRTSSKGIQLTLYDMFHQSSQSFQESSYEEVWGHYPENIDDTKIMRIVFSNPRGLKLSTDILETEYSFGRCQALGVGAICIAESNLNWGNLNVQGKFHGILKKIWRHTKTSKSYRKENFQSEKQPGGTATMVCNHWTSRVVEAGVDPFGLGRWSYVVMRGQGGKKKYY
jgi:hypothetical protein